MTRPAELAVAGRGSQPFPVFPSKTAGVSLAAQRMARAAPAVSGSLAGNPQAAQRFLSMVWFPASRRWRYPLNGKTGNTYTLQLLFWLEFGSFPGVQLRTPTNHHPELAIFSFRDAGLVRNFADVPFRQFREFPGITLVTVRNPYARAVSGFRYLCRSQTAADMRFVRERLRLNALTGFDWDNDPDSPAGFRKFLAYVEQMQTHLPAETDAHWLPQVDHVRPDVLRPDIIGATEDMNAFTDAVIAALVPGTDIPRARLARNTAPAAATDLLADSQACALVRRLYARDFAAFGYSEDPARIGMAPDIATEIRNP
jgi:hypothetical protein